MEKNIRDQNLGNKGTHKLVVSKSATAAIGPF